MPSQTLPVGSFVRLAKPALQGVIDALQQDGYRTVGPQVVEGVVVLNDLTSVDQLPIGIRDEQQGGRYRLQQTASGRYFDFSVGPDSFKRFLFPPQETLLECELGTAGWNFYTPQPAEPPLAALGVRACDLRAIEIQDRVFLGGPYVDPNYQRRRLDLFVLAVNCARAAATCFCHSQGCGPGVRGSIDIGLTELEEWFILEIGTPRGGKIAGAADWAPCSIAEIEAAQEVPRRLAEEMEQRPSRPSTPEGPAGRRLQNDGIRDLLLHNPEHPRWQQTAQRCLACGNCTQVCPTCFCSSIGEVSDLRGQRVARSREWTSCFASNHSYMSTGSVRKTIASRYRQWLTHKLASWYDQFGESGCVGCGRCITWCPVGIDLTEEVAAIRETGS